MLADLALSLLVVLAAWSLALLVWRDRPDRRLHQTLAGLLAAEGLLVLTLFHSGAPDDPLLEALLLATGIGAAWSVILLNLLFLGCIGAPLTRGLDRPRVRRALVALLALAWAHSAAMAAYHLATRSPVGSWGNSADLASGVCALAVALLSLAAGASALRHAAPGTLARARARAYLLAFGARDAGLAVGLGVGLLLIPVWHGGPAPPTWAELVARGAPRVGSLAYAVALASAILRVQVLDLGLRARVRASARVLSAALLALALGSLAALASVARVPSGWTVIAFVLLAAPAHLAAARAGERLARALRAPERLDERRRALEAAAAEDERTLPRYVEEAELGRGSEGRAFRAWDRVLERRVVVKEVWEDRARPQGALDEARAAARVDHPHVVRLHDVQMGPRTRLVFEHVDGETLAARLRRHGPLPPARAVEVALDVLEAAAAIHRAGLVHADIKPENILLGHDGRARLLDLGLASVVHSEARGAGSRPYASPEQTAGRPVDARADVHSIGMTLAQALHPGATLERAIALAPAPIAAVLARATDPVPARRYAAAEDMRAELIGARSSLPSDIVRA